MTEQGQELQEPARGLGHDRNEARVTLHVPAEKVAGRPGCPWGTLEPIDAGTCEFRTGDDDLCWLAVRITILGVDFEVHEPPELIERIAALGDRLGRAVGQARVGAGRS